MRSVVFLGCFLFCSFSIATSFDDLVERDGVYYQKSSQVPYTGQIDGIEKGLIRDGKKEEGKEDVPDADSQEAEKNLKKTNRLTYRHTVRNKNKNQLEMEVEKDLTTLKNALYQKRELKKKFNKADQIISLEDIKILKQYFIQLIQRKKVYLRTQSINSDWICEKFKYDE